MSKSLNNFIGITDAPDEMFGKLMSISDQLMWRYYELLSFCSLQEIARLRQEAEHGRNPRDIKCLLAQEIVTRFYDKKKAQQAQQHFVERFKHHELPNDLQEIIVQADSEQGLAIGYTLLNAGLVTSTSDALRMLRQSAVRIDGERVIDSKRLIKVGSSHVFQVGKRRFAKVKIVVRK